MKEISSGLRNWILVLAILSLVVGLLGMFAQEYLMILFAVQGVPEPGFLRLFGAFELGLAFLFFKTYGSKVVAVVDFMVKGTLVIYFWLFIAGFIDYFYNDVYTATSHIIYFLFTGIVFLITLFLYKKSM